MKLTKIVAMLVVAIIAKSATTGYSQGTVLFQNSSSTLIYTNGLTGLGVAGTTSNSGIRIQLFYQPDTGGSAPTSIYLPDALVTGNTGNWQPLLTAGQPIAAQIEPAPGRIPAMSEVKGTDVAPGGEVWLVALGWNGNYQNIQAAAAGGLFTIYGESAMWSQATGGEGTPQATPVSTSPYFAGMVLDAPEPGTITLGGIGAAALLLFRRRK